METVSQERLNRAYSLRSRDVTAGFLLLFGPAGFS